MNPKLARILARFAASAAMSLLALSAARADLIANGDFSASTDLAGWTAEFTLVVDLAGADAYPSANREWFTGALPILVDLDPGIAIPDFPLFVTGSAYSGRITVWLPDAILGQDATLYFDLYDQADNASSIAGIDNVSVQPTRAAPAPATLGLLLVGLAAGAAARRAVNATASQHGRGAHGGGTGYVGAGGTGHSPRPERSFRRQPSARARRSEENVSDGVNAPSGILSERSGRTGYLGAGGTGYPPRPERLLRPRRDGAFAPSRTFDPSPTVDWNRQVRRKRFGRGECPVRPMIERPSRAGRGMPYQPQRDGAFAPSQTFIPSPTVDMGPRVRRKCFGRGECPVRPLPMALALIERHSLERYLPERQQTSCPHAACQWT